MVQVILMWTPIVVSIAALFFSMYRGQKSDKQLDTKEFEERIKENTKINYKLDEISKNLGELKHDVTVFGNDERAIENRVAVAESSLKSLHKRVDTMESRLNFDKSED